MLRSIVYFLIHPTTLLVVGFFVLWITRKKWQRPKRRVLMFFLVLYAFLITTPFYPEKLVSYLEDQYPPIQISTLDTGKEYHVVVLGGGMGYDDRLPPTSQLEPVMLARLVEGIRIFRQLPNCKLITSGYSSIGRKPQGEVAREAAISLGITDSLVFAQGTPSNTMEEAEAYVQKWGVQTPLIISTSAIHIPRAVYIFKKAGVKEIFAAPTHYKIKKQNPRGFWRNFKPRLGYIGDLNACLHEIVGLWYAEWVMPKESHSESSLREPTQPNIPVAK
jgi:uncharacterized SAM-binding protein YcdF (DUF218 family)